MRRADCVEILGDQVLTRHRMADDEVALDGDIVLVQTFDDFGVVAAPVLPPQSSCAASAAALRGSSPQTPAHS